MALLRGHSISIRYVHCPYLTPQGDPSHHWAISPSYIYCYIHLKMGFKKLIAMCASLSRPAGSMIYHIDRDYREPGYLVIDVTFVWWNLCWKSRFISEVIGSFYIKLLWINSAFKVLKTRTKNSHIFKSMPDVYCMIYNPLKTEINCLHLDRIRNSQSCNR